LVLINEFFFAWAIYSYDAEFYQLAKSFLKHREDEESFETHLGDMIEGEMNTTLAHVSLDQGNGLDITVIIHQ
jgi:hypothetical protein